MANRPSWDEAWMAVAQAMAARGTCARMRVGAVIVSPDHRMLASGYNGAPRGQPHCTDVGCLIVDGHCVRAVHAELNAMLNCQLRTAGNILYTTRSPCIHCANALLQVGIIRVVYQHVYYHNSMAKVVAELLRFQGVELVKYGGTE